MINYDKIGNLWVGTDGNGLLFSASGNSLKNFTKNTNASNSFIGGSITTFFEDNQSNIWFGTARNGLIIKEQKEFNTSPLQNDLQIINGLPTLSIHKKNHQFLFGMDGEGLNVLDTKQKKWTNIHPGGAIYIQFIQEKSKRKFMARHFLQWLDGISSQQRAYSTFSTCT